MVASAAELQNNGGMLSGCANKHCRRLPRYDCRVVNLKEFFGEQLDELMPTIALCV